MLTLADIRAAHARIRPHILRTPVLTNPVLDEACGAQFFFKCENLQAIGAFKARGATNAVFALDAAAAARGVCTHSSGNHGAALARAARIRGIPASIVMPTNAPRSKVANVERQGARIEFCAPTQQAREEACARIVATTGATLIHPFENFEVMAGQGTATIELLEDAPNLDLLVCPVGGGGLLAGTAVAAKGLHPGLRVIAAEPAQADDAAQSFRAGRRVATTANTIADGLRTVIGEPNLAIVRAQVDDILTVSEAGILAAMRQLWEELKVVVEPSGAVPWGVIRENKLAVRGLRVGVILTGGNIDLDRLPWQT